MSDGNLPDVEAHVKVYTDSPCEFPGYETVLLNDLHGKHQVTTRCFIDALKEGYPIVPIASDMIASTGLLLALERHAASKRLVMVPVLRTDATSVLPELDELLENHIPLGPHGRIRLTPRQLCELGFEHIHHRLMHQFIENIPGKGYPTTVFRKIGDTISARCFHMHPLLLNPADIKHVTPTIDGEMMSLFKKEEIHIVTDSDEMVVFDISDPDYNWNGLLDEPIEVAKFANRKTINMHRWFFTHECYLHSGELEKFDEDPRMAKILTEVANLPSR